MKEVLMGHSRAVHRLAGLVAVGGLVLVGTAAPAAAKTPPFTLVVERTGAQREVVKIIVRFEDRGYGELARRDGLLGLFPAKAVTRAGRLDPEFAQGYKAIPLAKSKTGVYTGRLKLPHTPGKYAIVAFPGSADYPLEQAGYPAPRLLTVES